MRFFFGVFLFCCWQTAAAQTTLSGIVKDKGNGLGLEYATVSLVNLDKGAVQDGKITDSSGRFLLADLQPGKYIVKADFMGYRESVSDTITLLNRPGMLTLSPLVLGYEGQGLEAVAITSRAPVIENKVDKIVYNAANDVTAQGGIALDILKKVPQVSVDADGNVELQGNPNIRFLINGKPSGALGNSVVDVLSSMPASGIKSIEVITSAGARYDAQGTGGIINIILKDNKAKGINGNVSLSAGTRLENGSANLNYRNGNIGFNAFVSGNAQVNSRALNRQERQSYDAGTGTSTRLVQDGYTDMLRKGFRAGIGMDWDMNKRNVFAASLQYSDFSNRREGITQQQETSTNAAGQIITDTYSSRNSLSTLHLKTLDWSLDYKKKLGTEGHELALQYTGSMGTPDMDSRQSQTYKNETSAYSGNAVLNPGKDRQHNLSLDYQYPLSRSFMLEAGVKGSFQHIESNNGQSVLSPATDQYIDAPGLSYHLNYDLSVYAAYVSASWQLLHWLDVKAGLRTEHTAIKLDYNNTHIPSYTTLVPSLLLSHEFSPKERLKLAYSRRLERPDYEELNPFLNLSDPYNISTGNPYLKPEMANNIELGYSQSFDNGINFYLALSERINTNDVKSFTAFYPVYTVGDSAYYNVSVTDRRNVGKEYNSGLILTGTVPMRDLSLRANVMLIHKHIVVDMPGASPVTNAFTARINLNAAYTLPAGLLAEAFGNYRSGFVSIQGKQPQMFTYTFALRKQLWNDKASIGITATNIFSKYIKQETTITTAGYTAYSVRELPFRSVGLTFSYKFGKLDFGKKQDKPMPEPDHLPSEN